ncbi:methionine gamma-lyase [Thermoactinomyces mirandus]|uniref:L-methionine gamma-lyase n=1 Tax=Thermoactinomyces mirandus TaxID=2756294 RepID=A0A7W1XS14_9BACL|nr:methionine gamma-lyase [Thermoactinomyces mirandus]MBA4602146.1 methionine gamma-lyase [Thermoactinomyces mirandus]
MKKVTGEQKWGFSTRAIHAGVDYKQMNGSLATPIFQTSTFVFPSAEEGRERFAGNSDGYIYSRLGNPTVRVLEEKIAMLEGTEKALAFASGMGAVASVLLAILRAGDHVVCSKGLYGCTYSLFQWLQERFGIEFTLCNMNDEEEFRRAIRPETRCLYLETPINPTLELIDLKQAVNVARKNDLIVIVDNTFMSPYLQRPIEWGADIVVHSATKFIGGHGDVVAGLAAGPRKLLETVQMTTLKDLGPVLSPMDAYLLIRGLKTLGARMDRHCSNALEVARFLEAHPKVESVCYPGLPSFPQHELAKRQMEGFGGLISFEVGGGYEAALRLLNHVSLCKLAVSLGDVDTLIQHPASMTHAVVPPEARRQMGITDGLIRLSVGIEDVEDILADLEEALAFV